MKRLSKQHIIVGISAGIAAYKSAILVRRLTDMGAAVRVMMTPNAGQFITPLTMQAVSGNPVNNALLDTNAESGMDHIELARWADCIVIAPATANLISQLCRGAAADIVTTVCLATDARVFIAPAMNQQMWKHPATVRNIIDLGQLGYTILGPGEGDQACGETGPGRMIEPEFIADYLSRALCPAASSRGKLLVTAGPTWEPLDPVRGITNRSSGKMGYAVAAQAARSGYQTVLVSGPTALDCPDGVSRINVCTAAEMLETCLEHIADCRAFIAVAAVADYRPAETGVHKLKKDAPDLNLKLVRNPDILATISKSNPQVFTVGFAAETENILNHAKKKLDEKQLDMICANDVQGGAVFGSDDNKLTIITREQVETVGPASKADLAAEILSRVDSCLKNAG